MGSALNPEIAVSMMPFKIQGQTFFLSLPMSERVTLQGKDWQKRDDEAQSRHPIRAER